MGEEKVTITYSLVPGTNRSSNCTFCGRARAVSDYAAGRYVVQVCDGCVEHPPGVVKAEEVKAEEVEEKLESQEEKIIQ